MIKTKNNPNSGFTLIELLLVVVIIGVLSGVLISIINPNASVGRAKDGVRIDNVSEVASVIETYRHAEFSYPATADATDSSSTLRSVYLKSWPGDSEDTYVYALSGDGKNFRLSVDNSLEGCFKYQADWHKVMKCPATECAQFSVAADCSSL